MMKKGPVFIKIDEYKEIIDTISLIKAKINESKNLIKQINDLKNEEDNELEVWSNELDEIERKIHYVDKTLFEPESF
jgi:hypothetical protein